jgi:hypothetical protein
MFSSSLPFHEIPVAWSGRNCPLQEKPLPQVF